MIFFGLYIAASLFNVALASRSNDWKKPCFSGFCAYDLPASAGSASGTLEIWGPETAIGDVTPAGGWEIIDCSPEALKQEIRLVCKDGRDEDCARLYTSGPVGKVVRLPEECGLNPFAVVAVEYVPDDQSIPESVARSLVRRDGSLPEVKALSITVDFKSGPSRKADPVNFAIRAANVPGADGQLNAASVLEGRDMSRVYERGLFDWIKKTLQKLAALNTFNINQSKSLTPIDINKNYVLVDKSVSCPPLAASLKIDVDASAHAVTSVGVAVIGTIIPPIITDFAVITGLSAQLNGALDIAASVTGSADTGNVALVNVAIPGLSFPGILEIGPSFQVNAQATANLDVELDMNVGINYNVNAQLVFPPRSGLSSGGAFSVNDTALQLSASAGVRATGNVQAHLSPVVSIGLNALNGAAKANVFLELDASASLALNLDASANGGVTVSNAIESADTKVAKAIDTGKVVASSNLVTLPAAPVELEERGVTSGGSASFSGCVDLDTGLDVSAGASASFFGLFDKSISVSLYNKKFDLFTKCYGASTSKKRSAPPRYLTSRSENRQLLTRSLFKLSCPASNIPDATSLVSQTISAAKIK